MKRSAYGNALFFIAQNDSAETAPGGQVELTTLLKDRVELIRWLYGWVELTEFLILSSIKKTAGIKPTAPSSALI